MRYLSLFSGIEAATVAWHPLGWEPVAFSEIEPFPCAVLANRYPDTPNLGDVTQITEAQIKQLGSIDLVVFGAPCQDLSIAGKQRGFKDEDGNTTRSGLFFDALRIFGYTQQHCGARFALWENVPGAFSSSKGRDFAEVVATMAGLDDVGVPENGWGSEGAAVGDNGLLEWGCLDAQWFGLAQRRNRVFALLDTGDWASRPPILLERESLRGDTPPSRETRQASTGNAAEGTFECSGIGEYKRSSSSSPLRRTGADLGNGCESLIVGGRASVTYRDTAQCLNAGGMGRIDYEPETMVLGFAQNTRDEVRYVNGDGQIAGALAAEPGMKQTTYLMTAAFSAGNSAEARSIGYTEEGTPPLRAADSGTNQVPTIVSYGIRAANTSSNGWGISEEVTHTLDQASPHAVATIGWSEELTAHQDLAGTLQRGGDGGRHDGVMTPELQVRRLTPKECARLQGFLDDYLDILFKGKPATDGHKYKALGNSMAVPVMRYIGEQIQKATSIDDLI